MWRDFFYFSKRERQGIVFLLIFIGGILLGKYIFTPKIPEPLIELEFPQDTSVVQYKDSMVPKKNISAFIPDLEKKTKSKESVTFPEKRKYYVHRKDTLVRPSSANYKRVEKLKAGERIELNSADTTDLKKIPGVGSGYACRIVNYRKILGGFYRPEQLQEVYGMHEELYEKIIPFIQIETEKIEKIPVNSSSLERLKAHPYINFYQAKIIIDLRKKKKILQSMEELRLLEEFTEDDLRRLAPYLFF